MGAGRETQIFPLKEKSARNLTKDQLGGVIFGCKNHTITECFRNEIFGLPAAHYSYVKNISPGFTLYLFNYSDRKLHGVFEAVSPGQMNINPYAWITSEGSEDTPYPAQVRVHEKRKCRPLLEQEFKPIIEKNYYTEKLFWFELHKEQNSRLMKLFFLLPEKMPPHVMCATETTNEEIKNLDLEECSEMRLKKSDHSYALVGNRDAFVPKKNWSELFKPSSSSYAMKNWKVLGSPKVRLNSSMSDYYDTELKFAPSSSNGKSTMPLEACLDDSASATSDSQYVIDKLLQEVEDLKVSQMKQRVKIEILEHELFNFKHK